MRRAAAFAAIASGILLVTVALALSMFDRTEKAERILDRFEFLTLDDNPERYLAEAEVTRGGSLELVETALPELAADAGVSEAALTDRHPALAAAQAEVPEAFDFSVRYSEQLENVEDQFQGVYDIPVSWLPLTATAWLFVLGGVACVLAGVAALTARGRGPLFAILALGGAMALGPVASGGLGKAADGEDVKDFAENGLTQRAAEAAQEAFAILDALVAETEEQTLPDIATAGRISPQALDTELSERYAESDRFLAEWEVIGPRLSQLADAVSGSVEEFDSARELPIALPAWLLVGAGLAMAVAAGLSLARDSAPR